MKNFRRNIKQERSIKKNIIIVLVFAVLFLMLCNSLFGKQVESTKNIRIMYGDSLWSIAEKVAQNTDENIQNVIIKIKKMNNLSNSMIYEGQILTIPVI